MRARWVPTMQDGPMDPAAYEEQLREQAARDFGRLWLATAGVAIVMVLGFLVWVGWHMRGWVR